MTTPPIDYRALFAATLSPYLVLGADLVILDANEAYCRAVRRPLEDLVGRYLFNAFPDNPQDPDAEGVRCLNASLHRVLRSGKPETLVVQKYDIPVPGRPGEFEERWGSPISVPVLGPDGQVAWILHRMDDVTDFVLSHSDRPGPGLGLSERQAMEAQLYVRAQKLQPLNDQLRQAHAGERKVAVTLQEAMMQAPDLARHPQHRGPLPARSQRPQRVRRLVRRRRPPRRRLHRRRRRGRRPRRGSRSRHGHTPQRPVLRSPRPARPRQGHGGPGPVRPLSGRSTGHHRGQSRRRHPPPPHHLHHRRPPPTGPRPRRRHHRPARPGQPLGVRPQHGPHPQALVPCTCGDTFVLYTDGLIERRGEDIDAGLHRLTDALVANSHLSAEALADTLLSRLGVSGGGSDDIALIVVRL